MATPQRANTPAVDVAYRKLVASLARRAARMGSADPQSAAQEAVRRSLGSPAPRQAIECYFGDRPDASAPEWSLLQLFGWLNGVVQFVVREERARARFRRELSAGDAGIDVHDPAPDQLDGMIEAERRSVIQACLAELSQEYRSALEMRFEGAKYSDIAARLGINENTLATRLRRGSIELARLARERMTVRGPATEGMARVSHG